MVASLRHPNIVAIYEVGECNGSHFLSLEFVEGRNFAELARAAALPAKRDGELPQDHRRSGGARPPAGCADRDLKPSNILLDVFDQPRVTDFGLAKLVNQDADLTVADKCWVRLITCRPNRRRARPQAAPLNRISIRWGRFSTNFSPGALRFRRETLAAILAQVQTAEPVAPRRLNPGTPEDLETICLKCLQKEPARRYVSARALADDLGRFLEGKPILARPVPPLERVWLWCRRRPLQAAMSAGLVTSVVLGVGGVIWQWRQAEFHAQGELKQRLIAEQNAATRLNLYAADVAVASQAIQDGNLGLARRTLDALAPKGNEIDLRGFEWRYLRHLCRGYQLATLAGHERTVTCVAFSPEGGRLATGGMDGAVWIWNVATHQVVTSLRSPLTPFGPWLFSRRQMVDDRIRKHVEFRDTGPWRVGTTFPERSPCFRRMRRSSPPRNPARFIGRRPVR